MTSCRSELPDRGDPEATVLWRWRPLREDDLDPVLAIERASFPSPWSLKLFQQELSNPLARCWVVEGPVPGSNDGPSGDTAGVAGYLCVWMVVDEMHVMNLAIHPALRRQGFAGMLMDRALALARETGVKHVVLEVRESNRAARSLYDSLGFRPVGRRPRYYSDTGEDAVVMLKEMKAKDEGSSSSDRVHP